MIRQRGAHAAGAGAAGARALAAAAMLIAMMALAGCGGGAEGDAAAANGGAPSATAFAEGPLNDLPLEDGSPSGGASSEAAPSELEEAVRALVEPYGDAVSVAYLPLESGAGAAMRDDAASGGTAGAEASDGAAGAGAAEAASAPAAFSLAGDAPRVAASTIKLPILAAVLQQAESGALRLDEQVAVQAADLVGGSGVVQGYGAGSTFSLEELARYMITESDNVATNLLISRVGMEVVNETAADLGLSSTSLQRLMMDGDAPFEGRENYTSANDLAALLAAIDEGAFVSPAASERARGFLLAQTDRDGIPAGVPAEVEVGNKTGTLAAAEHDAALVYATHPYALVILTETLGAAEATSLIQQISQTVYQRTNG